MPIKKIILLFVFYSTGAILFESVQKVEGHKKTPYNLRMLQSEGQSKQDLDELYQTGFALLFSGFIDRGNAIMDSVFELSQNPNYLERKASANLYQGEYGETMRTLNRAVEVYEDNESLGYRAWVNLIYLKNYKEAIKDLTEFEKNSPEPSFTFAMSAMMLKGITYKQMGNYVAAVDQLSDYVEETDSNIVDIYAYWYRGMTWFEMEETEKAIADYDYFLKKYPNGPEAHYHKGLALLSKNQKEEACKCFKDSERLIRKGYRRAYVWHALPDELHLGDVEKMIKKYCP